MVRKTSLGMSAEDIRQLVATEVAQAITEAIPTVITAIREQLETVIDERVAMMGGAPRPIREFSYRDFSACSPPLFSGSPDPIVCMRWISDVEGAFLTSGCPDNAKVRCASNLLRDAARDWWATWIKGMENHQIVAIPWTEFVTKFRAEHVPRVEMDRLAREFLTFEQTTETIPELNRKFNEMALFCPQYAANEEMKMARYMEMLRTNIREFIVASPCTTLAALMEAARRREIELETQIRKRKMTQGIVSAKSGPKKKKTFDNGSFQRGIEHVTGNDDSRRDIIVATVKRR